MLGLTMRYLLVPRLLEAESLDHEIQSKLQADPKTGMAARWVLGCRSSALELPISTMASMTALHPSPGFFLPPTLPKGCPHR